VRHSSSRRSGWGPRVKSGDLKQPRTLYEFRHGSNAEPVLATGTTQSPNEIPQHGAEMRPGEGVALRPVPVELGLKSKHN